MLSIETCLAAGYADPRRFDFTHSEDDYRQIARKFVNRAKRAYYRNQSWEKFSWDEQQVKCAMPKEYMWARNAIFIELAPSLCNEIWLQRWNGWTKTKPIN
jgi:hypothetical protein